MPQFMTACDVVAFPTTAQLSEGFGLVGLEAMAAGRPVVATAVGPVPDVIDDHSGILVPDGSIPALADALVRLAADPDLRTRMGETGAQRAQKTFGLAAMVERTVAVYERVLTERR
jgi:glycosyltransferase involved in cell wall biosynthesis